MSAPISRNLKIAIKKELQKKQQHKFRSKNDVGKTI